MVAIIRYGTNADLGRVESANSRLGNPQAFWPPGGDALAHPFYGGLKLRWSRAVFLKPERYDYDHLFNYGDP